MCLSPCGSILKKFVYGLLKMIFLILVFTLNLLTTLSESKPIPGDPISNNTPRHQDSSTGLLLNELLPISGLNLQDEISVIKDTSLSNLQCTTWMDCYNQYLSLTLSFRETNREFQKIINHAFSILQSPTTIDPLTGNLYVLSNGQQYLITLIKSTRDAILTTQSFLNVIHGFLEDIPNNENFDERLNLVYTNLFLHDLVKMGIVNGLNQYECIIHIPKSKSDNYGSTEFKECLEKFPMNFEFVTSETKKQLELSKKAMKPSMNRENAVRFVNWSDVQTNDHVPIKTEVIEIAKNIGKKRKSGPLNQFNPKDSDDLWNFKKNQESDVVLQ